MVVALKLRKAEDVAIEGERTIEVMNLDREVVETEGAHGTDAMVPRESMARLLIVEDNNALAALLVAAVESRGHEGIALSTGQAALQSLAIESFDAAVVDLLLPDLHGFDVLDKLAARRTPAFAMSGVYKGDAFVKESVEEHGARGFFSKPFDLESLLDAFEEVCGIAPRAPAEPPSSPAARAEDPLAFLAELPAVDELELGEPELPASVDDAAVQLPFSKRGQVWRREDEAAGAARAAAIPGWAKGGDLARTPVPRLLNAFYEARHHGELKLKRGNVLKLVLFENGRPIYAASNLAQERFARFCVRRGLLTENDVSAVAQLSRETNARTGDAMVQLGLLKSEQRTGLLVEQVKEIIWSTFSWSDGSFSFEPKRSNRGGLVKLSVFPGDLILEGVLRTETLVALRAVMGPDRRLTPTQDPPYGLHELTLSGPQAMLLAYADGSKRVTDLLSLTDLSEREALGTLRGFELLGLVEERREQRPSRISFGL